jgi:hypothetical protein
MRYSLLLDTSQSTNVPLLQCHAVIGLYSLLLEAAMRLGRQSQIEGA